MTVVYRTYVEYDSEAGIWFTESSTIPGLGASGSEITQVVASLNSFAPLMLQENVFRRENRPHDYNGPKEIQHEVVVINREGLAQRHTSATINAYDLS
jgi:hypothetical protein